MDASDGVESKLRELYGEIKNRRSTKEERKHIGLLIFLLALELGDHKYRNLAHIIEKALGEDSPSVHSKFRDWNKIAFECLRRIFEIGAAVGDPVEELFLSKIRSSALFAIGGYGAVDKDLQRFFRGRKNQRRAPRSEKVVKPISWKGGDSTTGSKTPPSGSWKATAAAQKALIHAQKNGGEVSPCSHYWRIEAPNGPTSPGKCTKCGAVGVFENY